MDNLNIQNSKELDNQNVSLWRKGKQDIKKFYDIKFKKSTNFKTLDNDGDGQITGNDMNNLMSTMQSKGLTYNEIQTLCATGNADSSLLSTVLAYFNKIDANGDGRVTSEEITKFSMNAQMYEVEQKYKSFKASSASLYYSDGVEDDTSSVLDTLQPNLGTNKTNS